MSESNWIDENSASARPRSSAARPLPSSSPPSGAQAAKSKPMREEYRAVLNRHHAHGCPGTWT